MNGQMKSDREGRITKRVSLKDTAGAKYSMFDPLQKEKKQLTLERRKKYNLNTKNEDPDHHEFANSD
jgi:hypothetical protein